MRRSGSYPHRWRTLRDTTVQVCLECDYAGPDAGPRLEFEPIPWPPRAQKRG